MAANIEAIATQFTDFYYQTFDTDRKNLLSLYRPNSVLTWEGQVFQGATTICEKLVSLPFEKVAHKVNTRDAQPSLLSSNSLILVVTGLLIVDDNTNALQFTQLFHLVQEGGSYYVLNDIFRLNYGRTFIIANVVRVNLETEKGASKYCQFSAMTEGLLEHIYDPGLPGNVPEIHGTSAEGKLKYKRHFIVTQAMVLAKKRSVKFSVVSQLNRLKQVWNSKL